VLHPHSVSQPIRHLSRHPCCTSVQSLRLPSESITTLPRRPWWLSHAIPLIAKNILQIDIYNSCTTSLKSISTRCEQTASCAVPTTGMSPWGTAAAPCLQMNSPVQQLLAYVTVTLHIAVKWKVESAQQHNGAQLLLGSWLTGSRHQCVCCAVLCRAINNECLHSLIDIGSKNSTGCPLHLSADC
jgi:hypothetical protein